MGEFEPDQQISLEKVDQAIQAYADVRIAKRQGEQTDLVTDFRARNVAIVACALLAQTDKSSRWSDYFISGLEERGIHLDSARLPKGLYQIAFASVQLRRNFNPSSTELLDGLLSNDPRAAILLPPFLMTSGAEKS